MEEMITLRIITVLFGIACVFLLMLYIKVSEILKRHIELNDKINLFSQTLNIFKEQGKLLIQIQYSCNEELGKIYDFMDSLDIFEEYESNDGS